MRASPAPREHDPLLTVKWSLTLGAGGLLIAGLIFFDPIGKVAATLVLLAIIQGLWRGSADIAGMLLGTLLAMLTAVPMAPWFEGITRAVFGFSGLANRIAATLSAGVLVLLIVAAVVSTLLRRLLRRSDTRARWDTVLGGSLGAVEGAILALAVTWVPAALAPIARAQIAAGPPGSASPQAGFVVRAADAVERSALAGLSNATNPIKGTRLLTASEDVLEVLSNDAMRAHFLASPVMREINTMPGVKRALDIINADKELIAVLNDGATDHAVTALVYSDTVMRAIDESGITAELTTLAPRIAEAVEAARASVKEKRRTQSEE